MEKETSTFEAFGDWLTLRNYATSTKRSYTSRLRQFLLWRQRRKASGEITDREVHDYLLERSERGLSWQSINGDYSAIQMYFTAILKREWSVEHLPRPRHEKSLPLILSVEEVGRLINAGSLLKHQAFMALLYGTGLRLSEALRLRIRDIDGERGQLRVEKGKGKKDRYVMVPPCLLVTLRTYYLACRPSEYLFNGSYSGGQWGKRAAQFAVEKAALTAGIIRPVSPHVLRHCYATHHLEKGTSIVFLKEQLGHANLSTTARYIHLCANYEKQVHHPLTGLDLQLRPSAERLEA
jgi:site-specific recombinase XerD